MTDDKKDARRMKKYGLTPLQYAALMAIDHCQICRRKPQPGKKLYIDHDHKTGAVRGMLCFTCNYRVLGRGALGRPEVHRAAAAYLERGMDWRRG